MLDALPAALTSLKNATDILSSLFELRAFSKYSSQFAQLQSCIIEANQRIISGHSVQASLSEKINKLEKECVRLKDWSTEKDKYEIRQVAPGAFAYLAKDFVGQFQDAHKLCSNCFDKTIKSTLQQNHEKRERNLVKLVCPNGCPSIVFKHYIPL